MKMKSIIFMSLSLATVLFVLVAASAKGSLFRTSTSLSTSDGTAFVGVQAYEYSIDENNKIRFAYNSRDRVIGILVKKGQEIGLYKQISVKQPLGTFALKLKKSKGTKPDSEIKISVNRLGTETADISVIGFGNIKMRSIPYELSDCQVKSSSIIPNISQACVCELPGHACSSVGIDGAPIEVDWWACFNCCLVVVCC